MDKSKIRYERSKPISEERLKVLVLRYTKEIVAYEKVIDYIVSLDDIRGLSFGLQTDIWKRIGETKKDIRSLINEYEENNHE